jgi:hypothetical protein
MLRAAVLAKAMPGDQPLLLCEGELSRMMAFKHEFPATAPRYCDGRTRYTLPSGIGGPDCYAGQAPPGQRL